MSTFRELSAHSWVKSLVKYIFNAEMIKKIKFIYWVFIGDGSSDSLVGIY